jgi:hypothetical protein
MIKMKIWILTLVYIRKIYKKGSWRGERRISIKRRIWS